jgi:hypothetical protein
MNPGMTPKPGSMYDRKDPAGNLDLMIKQLSHSEEALDGKR